MSSEIAASDDIKQLVKDIISKNNLKEISDVIYRPGSEIGDGYIAKTMCVDIVKTDGEVLKIFLKCAKNVKSNQLFPIEKLYSNEIYFYDFVYPQYLQFLEERNAKSIFQNIPKCYGTSTENNIIALEDIRIKGFTLFNRKKVMDDSHISLALKTFARFHAISYAFKDQKRTIYDQLVNKSMFDFMAHIREVEVFGKSIDDKVNKLVRTLDPTKDKHILDKCDNLSKLLIESMSNSKKCLNEYSIITQGDCWCNNIMFLYEEENGQNPVDIRLIDWQLVRQASPVFDISYFFYPIASEGVLEKLDNYLAMYHEELSKYIKVLGSDPEILYPFQIFKEEWKKHCKFGFAMAFLILRAMLATKEETINIEEIDFENLEEVRSRRKKPLELEDEYIKRLTILADHFVRNDFL